MTAIALKKEQILMQWENLDQRTTPARILQGHALEFANGLGGIDVLSHHEIILCRRLAELSMMIDAEMANLLSDVALFQQENYIKAVSTFDRMWSKYEKLAAKFKAKRDKVVNPYG